MISYQSVVSKNWITLSGDKLSQGAKLSTWSSLQSLGRFGVGMRARRTSAPSDSRPSQTKSGHSGHGECAGDFNLRFLCLVLILHLVLAPIAQAQSATE